MSEIIIHYLVNIYKNNKNYNYILMFNRNLRYFCEKEGLSQQKLADLMGVKRGKVSGYFYKTTPKIEFQNRFAEQFNIDLGKFLTVEMMADNYHDFFTKVHATNMVADSPGSYSRKSELIDLLLEVKKTEDRAEVNRLVDEVIRLYGKVLDENSRLKDANSHLKDRLLGGDDATTSS